MSRPKVYTIDPNFSFLDVLAFGFLKKIKFDREVLAQSIFFLPTQRSVANFASCIKDFFDNRTVILPTIRPLGDLMDEELFFGNDMDPLNVENISQKKVISRLRRRLLLTQLVERFMELDGENRKSREGRGNNYKGSVGLANALATMLDRMQIEGISLDKLENFVPEEHAMHWQTSFKFLKLLIEYWPKILEEENLVDPAIYTNNLLGHLSAKWEKSQTDQFITIAGSTGSMPATAELIKVVASLKNGAVVLPGLDQREDEKYRKVVVEDATHPQHMMFSLLDKLGIQPGDVQNWLPNADNTVKEKSPAGRFKLFSEALLPPALSGRWRSVIKKTVPQKDLEGIIIIESEDLRAEAETIALIMRETLEHEARSAALITSDRNLARHVTLAASRWNLSVYDSAGQQFLNNNYINFWRLVSEMVFNQLAPIPLLSALKHPLANGGLPKVEFQKNVSQLEILFLRGERPKPGIDGLLEAVNIGRRHNKNRQIKTGAMGSVCIDNLYEWLLELAPVIRSFEHALVSGSKTLPEMLLLHLALVEKLSGPIELNGETTETNNQIIKILNDFYEQSQDFQRIDGISYTSLFETVLSDFVIREKYQEKPKLAIFGPLEGRLSEFDRIIIGGLNEGAWPPVIQPDPWLGRSMQEALGLMDTSKRIGQSAHDFLQAVCAPEVFLTRSLNQANSPTTASRWLMRLSSIFNAIGQDSIIKERGQKWQKWQKLLDQPKSEKRFGRGAPQPKPSREKRPCSFSVTQVGIWLRNPYAIYAKKILRLEPLDPIDRMPSPIDRGNFIHKALEIFASEGIPENNNEALVSLIDKGREIFSTTFEDPVVWAFWWPRFERIAEWFVQHEAEKRQNRIALHVEKKGIWHFILNGRPVQLRATADRIDQMRNDKWVIIDYKTGAIPSRREVEGGLAPQLPLEAVILAKGGFENLPAKECAELQYYHLTGGNTLGKAHSFPANTLIVDAERGFLKLLNDFDNPEMPYLYAPDYGAEPIFDDYGHLARVKEWR